MSPSTEAPDPARARLRFVEALTAARAYEALDGHGVLTALAGGATDEARVARRLGLDARVVRTALEVLEHHGITAHDADGWRLAVTPGWLARIAGADVSGAMAGRPPAVDTTAPADAEALYPAIVESLADFADPAVPEVVEALLAVPVHHLVEVAAGASPWGRALCRAAPGLRVTALDLPDVVAVTRQVVAGDGLDDRYRFVAGDVFEVEPDEAGDLVVVAGFCRLLGTEANRRLFARIAPWCRPGGRVAVIDAVSTPAARAAGLAVYELGLLTRTSQGGCWSLDRYARWLTAAGFEGIDVRSTSLPMITLVTAYRREDR